MYTLAYNNASVLVVKNAAVVGLAPDDDSVSYLRRRTSVGGSDTCAAGRASSGTIGSGGRGAALLARDMTGLGCDSRVASPWKMAPWGQFNESVLAQYLRSKQNQGHV
jgi:hypothetical protein